MRPTARFLAIALTLAAAGSAHAASGGHDAHAGHGKMAATAAGEPGRAGDAKRTVRITAGDERYDTGTIPVRAGETVRFIVTNKGSSTHEFAIATADEKEEHRAMMQQMPDMKHDAPNVVVLAPGETQELVWRFGSETSITFACNIPGHETMEGRFAVSR